MAAPAIQAPQMSQHAEECVLLAELHVPLTADGQVADFGKVVVDEEHRPYLIHLRMLQEWVLCGRPGRAMGVGADAHFCHLVCHRSTDHPGLDTSPAAAQCAHGRGDGRS